MAVDERLLARVRSALGRRRVVEKRMFGGVKFLLPDGGRVYFFCYLVSG